MIRSADTIHYVSQSRSLHRATDDTMIVDVFKTNVDRTVEAKIVTAVLVRSCKSVKISFDLGDCDKVLRIEHSLVPACEIIALVNQLGFACEELTD